MDSLKSDLSGTAQKLQLANLALDIGVSVDGDDQISNLARTTTKGLTEVINTVNNLRGQIENIENTVKSAAVNYGSTLTSLGKQSAYFYAETQKMGTALRVMARNLGASQEDVTKTISEVRKLGVTSRDAMSSVRSLLQTRLDPNLAKEIAGAARNIGVFARGTSDAMDRVTIAMQTTSTEILQYIGLSENASQVFARYARQHNLNAQALSEAQKRQAIANYFIQEGTKLTGAYEESMKDAGKILSSMTRLEEEFANVIGERLVPALKAQLKVKQELYETFEKLNPALQTFIINTGMVGGKLGELIPTFARIGAASFQFLSIFINPALIAGFMMWRGHLQPLLEMMGPRMSSVLTTGASHLAKFAGAGHPAVLMIQQLANKAAAGTLVFRAFGREVNLLTSGLDSIAMLGVQQLANVAHLRMAGAGFGTKESRQLGSNIIKSTVARQAPLTLLEAMAIRAQGLRSESRESLAKGKLDAIMTGTRGQKLEYMLSGWLARPAAALERLFGLNKSPAPIPTNLTPTSLTPTKPESAAFWLTRKRRIIPMSADEVSAAFMGRPIGGPSASRHIIEGAGTAASLTAQSILDGSKPVATTRVVTAGAVTAAGPQGLNKILAQASSVWSSIVGFFSGKSAKEAIDAVGELGKNATKAAKSADSLGGAITAAGESLKNTLTEAGTSTASNVLTDAVSGGTGGAVAAKTLAGKAKLPIASLRMPIPTGVPIHGPLGGAIQLATSGNALLPASNLPVAKAAWHLPLIGKWAAGAGPLATLGVGAVAAGSVLYAGHKINEAWQENKVEAAAENRFKANDAAAIAALKRRAESLREGRALGIDDADYRSRLEHIADLQMEATAGPMSPQKLAMEKLHAARARLGEFDRVSQARDDLGTGAKLPPKPKLAASYSTYSTLGVVNEQAHRKYNKALQQHMSALQQYSQTQGKPTSVLMGELSTIRAKLADTDIESDAHTQLMLRERQINDILNERHGILRTEQDQRKELLDDVEHYSQEVLIARDAVSDLFSMRTRLQALDMGRQVWSMSRLESGLRPYTGDRTYLRTGVHDVTEVDEQGNKVTKKAYGTYETSDIKELTKAVSAFSKLTVGLREAERKARLISETWSPEEAKQGRVGYPGTKGDADLAYQRAIAARQEAEGDIIQARQKLYDIKMSPKQEFQQYADSALQLRRSRLQTQFHTGQITLQQFRDGISGIMPYAPGPSLTSNPEQVEQANNQRITELFDLDKQRISQQLENLSFLKQTYKINTDTYREEVKKIQHIDKETFRQKIQLLQQLEDEHREFWNRERDRSIAAQQRGIAGREIGLRHTMADNQAVLSQPPIGSFAEIQQWNASRQYAMHSTTLATQKQVQIAQDRARIVESNIAHIQRLLDVEQRGKASSEELSQLRGESASLTQQIAAAARHKAGIASTYFTSTNARSSTLQDQINTTVAELKALREPGNLRRAYEAQLLRANAQTTGILGAEKAAREDPRHPLHGQPVDPTKALDNITATRAFWTKSLQEMRKQEQENQSKVLEAEERLLRLTRERAELHSTSLITSKEYVASEQHMANLLERQRSVKQRIAELEAMARAPGANKERIQQLKGELESLRSEQQAANAAIIDAQRNVKTQQYAEQQFKHSVSMETFNRVMQNTQTAWSKTPELQLNLLNALLKANAEGKLALTPDKVKDLQGQSTSAYRDAVQNRVQAATSLRDALKGLRDDQLKSELESIEEQKQKYILATKDRVAAELWAQEMIKRAKEKANKDTVFNPENFFTVVGGVSGGMDFKLDSSIKRLNKSIITNEAELAAVSEQELMEISANVVNLSALNIPGYSDMGGGRLIPTYQANILRNDGRELPAGMSDSSYRNWSQTGVVPDVQGTYGEGKSAGIKASPTEGVVDLDKAAAEKALKEANSGNVGAMDITIKGELTIVDGDQQRQLAITKANTMVSMRSAGDLHSVGA